MTNRMDLSGCPYSLDAYFRSECLYTGSSYVHEIRVRVPIFMRFLFSMGAYYPNFTEPIFVEKASLTV